MEVIVLTNLKEKYYTTKLNLKEFMNAIIQWLTQDLLDESVFLNESWELMIQRQINLTAFFAT